MGSEKSLDTNRLPANLERGKFYNPTKERNLPLDGSRASFAAVTITPQSLLFMEERVKGGWRCVMNNVEPTGNEMRPDLVTLVLMDEEIDLLGLQPHHLDNGLAVQKIITQIASTRDHVIAELVEANPALAPLFGEK